MTKEDWKRYQDRTKELIIKQPNPARCHTSKELNDN